MKYTTAKTILKIYRKEGRFNKKKQRLAKGYAKNSSQCLGSQPTDKQPSIGCNSTTNAGAHSDLHKDNPFMLAPTKCAEPAVCGSFWAARIAEHFL